MPLNDPPDRRQPYSCPFEILVAVKTLKRFEKFSGMLHVESSAIVPYEEDLLARSCGPANLDHCHLSRARVLDGIADQIDENLLD
jgi:hypothetical protein